MSTTNVPFWGNPGWIFSQIGTWLNPTTWFGNNNQAMPSYSNGQLTNTPNNSGNTNSLFSVNPTLKIDTPALIIIGVVGYMLLTKGK